MVLSLLLEGRVSEYVEAARKDAGLWLFVHVPKTAGSSLSTELARIAPPYFNIHIDHSDRSQPGPVRFEAAVDAFIARAADRPFKSASGHINAGHLERISEAVAGVKPITMLRHPLARLVSDFRYQLSPMHPLHAEVARRTPDFASFMRIAGQRNRTTRHLVPQALSRSGDVEACLSYILRRYAFVGLQESYDLHFQALTKIISGQALRPKEKKRVNDSAGDVDISPALADEIAELHRLDFQIYEALAARLKGVEPQIAAWVDEAVLAQA